MQVDKDLSGPGISILKLTEMPEIKDFERQLDHIFFSSSATKTFADETVRQAFRERWLGRYLKHDQAWFYVALAGSKVAGYLAGSIDDPAQSERFSDIGYFPQLADETERYPAHLHVNVDESLRSGGLGSQLIERFLFDLRHAGVPGVHLVTGRFSRNVAFYERNGFVPVRCLDWGDGEVLMLGRLL
jgi:GNAT superfamily N-acetyltransferase